MSPPASPPLRRRPTGPQPPVQGLPAELARTAQARAMSELVRELELRRHLAFSRFHLGRRSARTYRSIRRVVCRAESSERRQPSFHFSLLRLLHMFPSRV
jgi:hypothetical protein